MHIWKETYWNSKPGQAFNLPRETFLVASNRAARLRRRKHLKIMYGFLVILFTISALIARKMVAIDQKKNRLGPNQYPVHQNVPPANLWIPH